MVSWLLARITSTIPVQERIVTVVEDRASAVDGLVAGEAPVVSGIDSSPLNETVSMKLFAPWRAAHKELVNKAVKCDARVAEHLKLTELAVRGTILELHADLMLPLWVQRQLKGNDRSIVDCQLVSACGAELIHYRHWPVPEISGSVTVAFVTLNRLINGL